jgi:hypothetical protein
MDHRANSQRLTNTERPKDPVGRPNVDLPVHGLGCVLQAETGEVRHVHCLLKDDERAGDEGLRCYDGGQNRRDQGRPQPPFRCGQEERVRIGFRMVPIEN